MEEEDVQVLYGLLLPPPLMPLLSLQVVIFALRVLLLLPRYIERDPPGHGGVRLLSLWAPL